MLDCKPFTRPGKPRLHFVRDQKNAVSIAYCSQLTQKFGRSNIEAALPLNRLYYDCSNSLWIQIRFEEETSLALQSSSSMRKTNMSMGSYRCTRLGKPSTRLLNC